MKASEWQAAVLGSDLSPHARLVALTVCASMVKDEAALSKATIVTLTGLSRASVTRALSELRGTFLESGSTWGQTTTFRLAHTEPRSYICTDTEKVALSEPSARLTESHPNLALTETGDKQMQAQSQISPNGLARVAATTTAEGKSASRSGLPTPPPGPPPEAANELVGWFVDEARRNGAEPPKRLIGHVAKIVGGLLKDGSTPLAVQGGLTLLAAKGVNPSALPSLVHQAQLKRKPPRRYGRGVTSDELLEAAREEAR